MQTYFKLVVDLYKFILYYLDMRKAIALLEESAIAFLETPKQDSIIMMTQVQKFGANQKLPQQYLRSEGLDALTPKQSIQQELSNREPIKHLLIGSPKAVISTIHYLQAVGYASVGDWSPLLPTANSHEVMSILIRQILVA